jgi:hypothetical protein
MAVRLTQSALIVASVALLATPALAVEPDVDSPAGPELPAPRTDRPDFQLDDQTGAEIAPDRGAQVIMPQPEAMSPDSEPGESSQGKTEDSDPSD